MPGKPLLFVFALISLVGAGAARADASDDALAKACPGIARWQAAERKAHSTHTGAAIAARDAARRFSAPQDRRQLLQRVTADQQVRDAAIAASKASDMDPNARKAAFQRMGAVDGDNLAWLKARVKRAGFPTVAEVGEQGMAAAFLLTQHADRDPAFQASVLKTLAARGKDMGIKKSDYALLTDRVLRAQGKPQRYGTQFASDPAHPGQMTMDPVEDPAGLDRRRAAMELPPIKDYECAIRTIYGSTPAKPSSAH